MNDIITLYILSILTEKALKDIFLEYSYVDSFNLLLSIATLINLSSFGLKQFGIRLVDSNEAV